MTNSQIAAMFHAAAAGKTRAEAAAEIGVSYDAVHSAAKKHRIPFRHAKEKAVLKKPRKRPLIGRVAAAGILAELTLSQRHDVVTLVRKGGQQPHEALATIGRADLAKRAAELMENAA